MFPTPSLWEQRLTTELTVDWPPPNELRPPLKLAGSCRGIRLTSREGVGGRERIQWWKGNKTLLVESVDRENSYLRANVVVALAVHPILST